METTTGLGHYGEPVEPHELTSEKARALIEYLVAHPAAEVKYLEARLTSHQSSVVVEMRVPVGQAPLIDIRPQEQLLIAFGNRDVDWPQIHPLRSDFPKTVTHLNASPESGPPTLCVSIESYASYRRRWTPGRYVELIRHWLRETSRGSLHGDDQQVEPFMLARAPTLILPHNMKTNATNDGAWFAEKLGEGVYKLISHGIEGKQLAPVVVHMQIAPPRVHGPIPVPPTSLEQLAKLVDVGDFSLLAKLDTVIRAWLKDNRRQEMPILVLQVPMMRVKAGEVEYYDLKAFTLSLSVERLATELGILDGTDPRAFLIPVASGLPSPALDTFNVNLTLSREMAASYNGEPLDNLEYAVIGVGALGSQITANLARSGLLPSAIVDNDRVLPHNLARHLLGSNSIGRFKAKEVANLLTGIVDSDVGIAAILSDATSDRIPALESVGSILDVSASVDVARHLARHEPSFPRSVSLFLNPLGTDLVMLAEDSERRCRLDELEMQYYWALTSHDELAGHLAPSGAHRYGASCRDTSSILKQTSISTLAGIGAEAFRGAMKSPSSLLAVWRLNETTGTVSRVDVPTFPMYPIAIGNWRIFISNQAFAALEQSRASRIPNETGGILIGSIDMQRDIIYVVGTVEGPRDSVECPTSYIRGTFGLDGAVKQISDVTAGNLEYLGEWHSHPTGSSTDPSDDDKNLLSWLKDHVSPEGIPAFMLIVGTNELSAIVDGDIHHFSLGDGTSTTGSTGESPTNIRRASPS